MRLGTLLIALLLGCVQRSETSYGACTSSDLCAASTPRCIIFANQRDGRGIGLCSSLCTTNADCADHGVCIETRSPGLPKACVQRCTAPEQCDFAGAICPVVLMDGTMGCVP